jgi:tyrosine-protein kinase Etk/Wzc
MRRWALLPLFPSLVDDRLGIDTGEPSSVTHSERYADLDQVSVVDYLIVIWRSRGFLFAFCIIAVLSALVFSLLAPKSFESTVTLLPPPEDNTSSAVSAAALMGKIQGFGFGLPGLTNNKQDILVSILESRTLAERLVDKYQLVSYYKADGSREAVKTLRDAMTVYVSKAGIISVTVADRDPRMAAELANAHAVELDKLLNQMDVSESSQRRRFVLDRLADTEKRLQMAEETLMHFQQKNSAVALREQAEGVMNVAVQLKGQIMAAEVELQVVRNFATESNPRVVGLKQRIEELKKQLAQVQYGTGLDLPGIEDSMGKIGSRYKEIHLAAANVPELGLQFARLTRDLKVQETVYTLLTQQLEEAKIAEARDVFLAVRVVDPAIPALYKSRPIIALNMGLAGALSLVLGICFVFIREYIDGYMAESQSTAN